MYIMVKLLKIKGIKNIWKQPEENDSLYIEVPKIKVSHILNQKQYKPQDSETTSLKCSEP